jgi:histidine triad (HIT) family protein
MHSDPSCIFCKIVAKAIPAKLVHEDDHFVVFQDINPMAPVHVLIVPKEHIASVNTLKNDHDPVAGQIMFLAKELAEKLNVSKTGFRLVMNTGAQGGQSVDHMHMHLLGGRAMTWPPG